MAASMKLTSGNKSGEHTASLLPAVISTLSSSNTQFQENEKREFERKYQESDQRLDDLVDEHYGQLTTLIDAFSSISDRLKESREKVSSIKDNLHSCKNLLHCKRDELRKFWLDGMEQNTITAMLQHVEDLRVVPDKLEEYTEKKLYLHATDTLCESLSLLKYDLAEVHALKNIAYSLQQWKEKLLQKLVIELHQQIYVKSVKGTVMVFKRHGSVRKSGKAWGGSVAASADEHNLANAEITEDATADPEADRSKFLAILVECLAKLDEVPKTISEMRSHLQTELMDVIRRASQQFIDVAYQQGEINLATHEQPAYLLELLELVFEQFRCVVHSHNVIIRNLKRIKSAKKYSNYKNLALYDITEVWIKIQVVVKQVLEEYLVDKSSVKRQNRSGNLLSNETDMPVATTERLDVNAFFNRRRPNQKKAPLFTFSGSSHAISLEKYLLEQRAAGYESGEVGEGGAFGGQPLNLVCKPAVKNITLVYKSLESFTNEIEMAVGCDPGECDLHRYVTDFIRDKFNKYIHEQMSLRIKAETEGFDSLKNLVDVRRQRELGSSRPLLKSTVTVMECVGELSELMQDLPDYCDYFMSMLIRILEDYRETSQQSYQGVVKTGHEQDHVITSATWATDEDIRRFLRSLPNWQNLQQSEDLGSIISEEERKSLNLKESQILTSNLSAHDSTIAQHEILNEPIQLKLVGNLHESLEWLCVQLDRFISTVPVEGGRSMSHTSAGDDYLEIPEIDEKTSHSLSSVLRDYRELADTCLLVLHIEVRVHCFYYLMPVAKQSNYFCAIDDLDADSNVVKLNRDLTGIEEFMKMSMQPKKFRYIFDGLGHLCSSLLINSVQYLTRINGNGVKKMCRNIFAIRQSLTNVTSSREMDLDLARQYYELLNLSMEQIINVIIEEGAKFTELEYIHLLTLIHRSQPGISDEQYNGQIQKLKRTITEKHVYHV